MCFLRGKPSFWVSPVDFFRANGQRLRHDLERGAAQLAVFLQPRRAAQEEE